MRTTFKIGLAALLCAVVCGGERAWANNIVVSNVFLSDQVTGSHWMVRFGLQWDNSWRVDLADATREEPYNYDAAWVFVKYRTASGDWKHATLSTNVADHMVPAGCALSVGQTSGRGVGVFIYRGTNGGGTFAAGDVRLKWTYPTNGLADCAVVTMRVYAIEMAYVPQGAFKVGDGQTNNGQFYEGGITNPFAITSENALVVTNIVGNLNYAATGAESGDRAGTISNEFPKGYAAFYGMKYELTQGQYVDFLNTLVGAQAATRYYAAAPPLHRYAITNMGGVYTSSTPYLACNFLSWADMAAYLDWAGLRPMTELEFEKACRGTNAPVAGEYAWGSTVITQATSIVNSGLVNEAPGNALANCAYGSAVGGPLDPMRVGCMGVGTGTRTATGAGYYGMMELSGNVWERPVTVGSAEGRSYTGRHGDGALDGNGDANVTGWPSVVDAKGVGFRGGNWLSPVASYERVSDRALAAGIRAGRAYDYGVGRGVRTAP